MLKRFDAVIRQFNGEAFLEADGKTPFTVKTAIVEALGTPYEDERDVKGEEKLRRFILGERIYGSGKTPTEVSVEDLTLIKALVAKRWTPFVVGFVFRYLESEESRSPTLAVVKAKAK